MEKKEILEKTTEIKDSAVKLFKQVDASLWFNGRLAVIFGLVIVSMLGMVLDRVDKQELGFGTHRDEFRQENSTRREMNVSFGQENSRRQKMRMMDDSFDDSFQEMDQMRNTMENWIQNHDPENNWQETQENKSDSIFGNIKNKVTSFFGHNTPKTISKPISSESQIEITPNTSVQKISVSDSAKQFTVNDENGSVSWSITTSQDRITKTSEAIKTLWLQVTIKDQTISFTWKLDNLNQLLKILEIN